MIARCSCGWSYSATGSREADSAARGHSVRCSSTDTRLDNDVGQTIARYEDGRNAVLSKPTPVRRSTQRSVHASPIPGPPRVSKLSEDDDSDEDDGAN